MLLASCGVPGEASITHSGVSIHFYVFTRVQIPLAPRRFEKQNFLRRATDLLGFKSGNAIWLCGALNGVDGGKRRGGLQTTRFGLRLWAC
jgi:hypothetical protein